MALRQPSFGSDDITSKLQEILRSRLGGNEQQEPQAPTLQDLLGQQYNQEQQGPIMQSIGRTNVQMPQQMQEQQEPQDQSQMIQQLLGGQQQQQMQPQDMNQQEIQQPQEQFQPAQEQMESEPSFGGIAKPLTRKQELDELKLQHAQQQEINKQALNERKFQHAQQREINKETLPFLRKVNEEAKAAKESAWRLDRMEALINTGELVTRKYGAFVKGLETIPYVGEALSEWARTDLNKESQEFHKISRDFAKGAKAAFGSRLTEGEVRLFLDTVPNLSLSTGGNRAVIRNLRLFNEAAQIKQKAMREVLAEHNGIRHHDFEQLVEEKAGPELDRIAEEFRKPIPKGTEEDRKFKSERKLKKSEHAKEKYKNSKYRTIPKSYI